MPTRRDAFRGILAEEFQPAEDAARNASMRMQMHVHTKTETLVSASSGAVVRLI